jgi:ubiquinone/menaquinone biosynthesis C-methylase UbiE
MDIIETARVKQKYDSASYTYDLMEMLPEKLFYRKWRAQALSHLSGRALEVGVGTGQNMRYYPEGVHVIAVDISEKMLAKAAKRARKLGLNVKFAVMDAQNLAFKDGMFDSAAATFVFCSVPDPVIGFSELGRVCKPSGKMAFLEHVRSSNRLLAAFMDLANPIILRLTGVNINRNTSESIRKAGARLIRETDLLTKVFKFIIAEPA